MKIDSLVWRLDSRPDMKRRLDSAGNEVHPIVTLRVARVAKGDFKRWPTRTPKDRYGEHARGK